VYVCVYVCVLSPREHGSALKRKLFRVHKKVRKLFRVHKEVRKLFRVHKEVLTRSLPGLCVCMYVYACVRAREISGYFLPDKWLLPSK
jgi:hypothetical protein